MKIKLGEIAMRMYSVAMALVQNNFQFPVGFSCL
jgi:hypothetical protein